MDTSRCTLAAALLAACVVLPAHAAPPTTPDAATERALRLLAAGEPAQAVPLLERAAAHWYPEADVVLGRLYEAGAGVPRDPARAARHYARAAQPNWMRVTYKRGHPQAQHALADERAASAPKAAYRLYKAAARAGHEGAQVALARAYAAGAGARSDAAAAYRWALIARAGDDDAVRAQADALLEPLRGSLAYGLRERLEREAARFVAREG